MRHNLRIFAGRDARRIRALEIWRAAFFPDRIHGDLRVGTGAACRIRPRQRPPASSEQNEGRVVFFVTLAFEIRVVPVEPRRSGSSVHAAKTRPSPRHRDRSATRDHRTRRGPGTQPAAVILADALLDLLLADGERFECVVSSGNDLKTCSQSAVLSPDEGADRPRRQPRR